MLALITKCTKKCSFKEDCITTCIAKESSLTDGCSKCFAEGSLCSVKQCTSSCPLYPDSESCKTCFDKNCLPDFIKCSGHVPPTAVLVSDNGACNDNDKNIVQHVKGEAGMRSDVSGCGLKCLFGEACIANCVASKSGITHGCAQCFASDTTCTMKHCSSQCTFAPNSAGCINCSKSNCLAGFASCSGIPAN